MTFACSDLMWASCSGCSQFLPKLSSNRSNGGCVSCSMARCQQVGEELLQRAVGFSIQHCKVKYKVHPRKALNDLRMSMPRASRAFRAFVCNRMPAPSPRSCAAFSRVTKGMPFWSRHRTNCHVCQDQRNTTSCERPDKLGASTRPDAGPARWRQPPMPNPITATASSYSANVIP